MSEQKEAKGIVVKNRNDQYAIIPAELFEQYLVSQKAVGKVADFYESDVEGQGVDYSWTPDWDAASVGAELYAAAPDGSRSETFDVFKIVL